MRKGTRKLTAVIVTAALVFSTFASGGPFARPAEAFDLVDAGLMIALFAEVMIAFALQNSINTQRDGILKATQKLQNRAIIEQRFDTTMYAHDHRVLSDDNRIDPTGITNTLLTSVSGLSGGDAEGFFTGRTGPTSSADFHGDYKKRAESLGGYAVGVMNANDRDMDRMGRYQAEALLPMVEALFAGDKKSDLKDIWKGEHGDMQSYHSYMLPYCAAEPDKFKDFDEEEDFLDEEILTGPGYRRTIQASGQISNLKNHLMAGVRASLTRQVEADVKYAHNEQQERADAHFAFEGAVGSWHSANGTNY